MSDYTNKEYADMYLMYGRTDCNRRLALRMYQNHFGEGDISTISPCLITVGSGLWNDGTNRCVYGGGLPCLGEKVIDPRARRSGQEKSPLFWKREVHAADADLGTVLGSHQLAEMPDIERSVDAELGTALVSQ
ncbi:hypothetical protein TNCV_1433621 [Trichonephila clavipes]|nr:hypothetical protein TNCV_1433621 [Trichonephila clavipes]